MTFIALQTKRTKSPYFDGCLRCIFKASLKIKAVVGGLGRGNSLSFTWNLAKGLYLTRSIKLKTRCHNDSSQRKNGITFPYFSLGWVQCTLTQHHFTCKITFEILIKTNWNSRQSHDIKWVGFFCQEITKKKFMSPFQLHLKRGFTN